MITSLKSHQVFVFGSNSRGFHGAGAAGYACRGDASDTWRTDPWFTEARRSSVGSPKRIGKWAVFGVARGYQEGREGKSYAIETINVPGERRSTPLEEIEKQVIELYRFAAAHPKLEFLMTEIGTKLAGYTTLEINKCVHQAARSVKIPSNVLLPSAFKD